MRKPMRSSGSSDRPRKPIPATSASRSTTGSADTSQSFRIVCTSCGKRFTRTLSPRIKCPECGRHIDFELGNSGPESGGTPRRKRPFDVGWRFVGTIVLHPEYKFAVATMNPAGFLPCRVEGHTRLHDLLNTPRSFEVVSRETSRIRDRIFRRLVLRPIGRPLARRTRDALALHIDPDRLQPRILTLKLVPEGESELERLASTDPVRAFERVTQLVSRRNDPAAWWLLALGHRAQVLRKPIEQAIKQIGVARFDRMVRQNPGTCEADWGIELLEFIDAEMERLRQQPTGNYPALPAYASAWDCPWWVD